MRVLLAPLLDSSVAVTATSETVLTSETDATSVTDVTSVTEVVMICVLTSTVRMMMLVPDAWPMGVDLIADLTGLLLARECSPAWWTSGPRRAKTAFLFRVILLSLATLFEPGVLSLFFEQTYLH